MKSDIGNDIGEKRGKVRWIELETEEDWAGTNEQGGGGGRDWKKEKKWEKK